MRGGSWWRWARPLGGAVILAVLVAWLGAGAFVDALRATDVGTLTAGGALAVLTTTVAAWRWRLVARALGAELSMPSAVAACYRAQFLNVALPGGVLGDVDRGVHHGREVDDVGRGLRAVCWERTSGQAVLVLVTVTALLVGRPVAPPAALVPVGVLVVTGLVVLGVAGSGHGTRPVPGAVGRLARVVVADAQALLTPATLAGIVVASLAAVSGHVAIFVLAARTVGVRMPLGELAPLGLLILLVAGVPLNLAGWGPREGAATWAFAAAGVGAAQGLAVAVAYGVIVGVSTLPGAVLLLVGGSRPSSPSDGRRAPLAARAGTSREVTAHG